MADRKIAGRRDIILLAIVLIVGGICALVMALRGIGAVETYNLVQIGSVALVFPLGVAALAWLITYLIFPEVYTG